MKMKDVELLPSGQEVLLQHPLIKANFSSLLFDFHFLYEQTMDVDHDEESIPEAKLAEVKTNLFTAFCYGAVTGTDTKSSFRRNFNLPEDALKKVAEKKSEIWTPDQDIKTTKPLSLV